MLRNGWRAHPFRQFLLKAHSRCNLACDYCYVYTLADQSWRSRPMIMAPELVSAVAGRIAEHAAAHRLDSVRLILHGGEPLLAGADYLVRAVRLVRDRAQPGRARRGGRPDQRRAPGQGRAARFRRRGRGRGGVSLDGTPRGNDRNRRYADGRSSYPAVAEALSLLMEPEFRHVYNGLLCTVDLANDPVETYEALLHFQPPVIDFLLPHGTWDAPPPGPSAGSGRDAVRGLARGRLRPLVRRQRGDRRPALPGDHPPAPRPRLRQ
ncbi:hypothetical protein ACFSTC_16580 [Nonomuraea ferruginea]